MHLENEYEAFGHFGSLPLTSVQIGPIQHGCNSNSITGTMKFCRTVMSDSKMEYLPWQYDFMHKASIFSYLWNVNLLLFLF